MRDASGGEALLERADDLRVAEGLIAGARNGAGGALLVVGPAEAH